MAGLLLLVCAPILHSGVVLGSPSSVFGSPSSVFESEELPYPRSLIPIGGAGAIFVVNTAGLANAPDVVTVQTLAGVLARTSPVIYTVESDPDAPANEDYTVFWLKRIQATSDFTWNYTFLNDFQGLLRHFARNVSGYVRFNLSSGSANAALIRCAAASGNAIAVGTDATANLLHELGVLEESDVSDVTPFAEFKHSRKSLNPRLAAFQPDDGRNAKFLSDYAVFGRFPTIEHAQAKLEAFQAVLDNFKNNTVNAGFGWGFDEHMLVAANTRAGSCVHASDFSRNLAFMSNLPPARVAARLVAPTPSAQQSVHTVAFMMSDGDNIQLLEGTWNSKQWYGSPLRGSVPMGWSYSAAVSVLLPPVMEWVQQTLTINDSLQTAPSGVGYAYPQLLPDALKSRFAKTTAKLMKASGMRLLNVLGVIPSVESMQAFVEQPEIDGIVYFSFSTERSGYAALHGNVAYLGGKPVISARMNLWGERSSGDRVGVEALVKELQTLPKDPRDPNSYSIIVVNMGSHGYADVVEAARLMEKVGGFEVVLPEHLVDRLVNETKREQQCPLPFGPWSAQVDDLPKCWFTGNGSCIMTCENLDESREDKVHASCDLDYCSNLTLASSLTSFFCVDGQMCPPARDHVVVV